MVVPVFKSFMLSLLKFASDGKSIAKVKHQRISTNADH